MFKCNLLNCLTQFLSHRLQRVKIDDASVPGLSSQAKFHKAESYNRCYMGFFSEYLRVSYSPIQNEATIYSYKGMPLSTTMRKMVYKIPIMD